MSYDFGTATVQEDYSRAAPPRRRRWVGVLATLILMGVFVGGLWFAYSRGLRKGEATADGGAPLFRADPGMVKVKPDQPGGMAVPNQDKLVYNPDRTDNGVERLLPPPEQPMAKPVAPPPAAVQQTPADAQPAVPGVATPGVPAQPLGAAAVAASPSAPSPTAPSLSAASSSAASPAVKTAAVPVTPPGGTATVAAPAAGVAPAGKTVDARKTQVASLPPASATPAPPAAPKSIASLLQSLSSSPAPVAAAPAQASAGSRVQLGAVKSEEEAKQEWERLRRASGDLLSGTSVQISRIEHADKSVFYRIQTSPVADASRLCDNLKTRKISCTVVR